MPCSAGGAIGTLSRTQRAAVGAAAGRSSVPPTSAARSRIATSPRPRAAASARRSPRPWSSTSSSSAIGLDAQPHPRLRAPGMPRHVAQRLLQHAIDVDAVGGVHRHAARRCARSAPATPSCLSTVDRYHSIVLSSPSSSRIDGCSVCDRPRTLSSAVCAISPISRRSARSGESVGRLLRRPRPASIPSPSASGRTRRAARARSRAASTRAWRSAAAPARAARPTARRARRTAAGSSESGYRLVAAMATSVAARNQ